MVACSFSPFGWVVAHLWVSSVRSVPFKLSSSKEPFPQKPPLDSYSRIAAWDRLTLGLLGRAVGLLVLNME